MAAIIFRHSKSQSQITLNSYHTREGRAVPFFAIQFSSTIMKSTATAVKRPLPAYCALGVPPAGTAAVAATVAVEL
jgi:hypothetical protein